MNIIDDVKIDARSRARLAPYVRAGEIYALEQPQDGVILMRRLVLPGPPRPKLVKRGKLLLLSSGKPLAQADVEKALEEFP